MIQRPQHLVLLVAIAVTACKGQPSSEPQRRVGPPPLPAGAPTLAAGTSLGPIYEMPDGEEMEAGTAFVIRDRQGRLYALTAAHVMDSREEWNMVVKATFKTAAGEVVAVASGKPVYVGRPATVSSPVAGHDLVVWRLAEGAKVTPLTLAAENPRIDEWVWVVGQERGEGPQKVFRCWVHDKTSEEPRVRIHDPIRWMGMSGAPIVNDRGEVVGSLLAGGDTTLGTCGIESIRARLAEAKIDVP